MIRIVIALVLAFLSSFLSAQPQLEQGMQQAFLLMKQNKNDEAANLLERIANAESDNWLPAYHLALLKTWTSFVTQDKEKRDAQIAAAEEYIASADALSPNNSEVYVVKALINVAKIASEPMVYGATLSGPIVALYEKAIALNPANPRAHSGLIEFKLGSARYFGQDLKPYGEQLQKTIPLYDAFKPESSLHPNWGKENTMELIKSCGITPVATEGVTIEVIMPNVVKKGGEVLFGLYGSAEDFAARKPLATQKAVPENGRASVSFTDVKPGTYAVMVMHDMNANRQMDFSANGMPVEEYGASNNSLQMPPPPSFEDAKFVVENKSVVLEIKF